MLTTFLNKDLLRYILSFQSGKRISDYNINKAIEKGFLPILEYHKNNIFNSCSLNSAARNGHLEVVKWLHKVENEIKIDCNKWDATYAMDCAAKYGYLETLVWLHENRKEGCTILAMNWAAENGYLEIVKWLHENRKEGCSKDAMNYAAGNGHLEVVKWLHENREEGCTEQAMNLASHNGHLETFLWLDENREEGSSVYRYDYKTQRMCRIY